MNPNETSASGEGRHYAFISYSHVAGGKLAPSLEAALQKFGKPLFARPSIEVFRDETGLALTPDLWGDIQKALEQANAFILLASPDSAKSEWVQQEIRFWLEHKPVERMFLVRADGDIFWSGNDFDWSKTDALPPLLAGHFKSEPLWADLTWAKAGADLSLDNPAFAREIAQLLAGIRQRPMKEILDAAVAETERAKKLFRSAVIALAALTVVALGVSFVSLSAKRTADTVMTGQQAEQQKKQAASDEQKKLAADEVAKQKRIEASVALAGKAAVVLSEDRELSRRLALAAAEISPTREAERALRATLLDMPAPLVLRGHSNVVTAVQFSADGKQILTSSDDGTVRLWEAGTGSNLLTLAVSIEENSGNHPLGVLSADGRRILTMGKPESIAFGSWQTKTPLKLYETATGRLVTTISDEWIAAAALSNDGQRIATAGFDTTVKIWEAATGKVQLQLSGHEARVESIHFNADCTRLVTASWWDGTARVWDAASGKNLAVLRAEKSDQGFDSAIFSPDGAKVLTLGGGDRAEEGKILQLWDWRHAPGGSIAIFAGQENVAHGYDFSPDGKYTAMFDRQTARVWDAITGKCLHVFTGHEEPITDLAFSPNSRWAVTASLDRTAVLWDLETGEKLVGLAADQARTCAAFSPDGKNILTGTYGGDVLNFRCELCGALDDLKALARVRTTRKLTVEEQGKFLGR